jgi:signal transduction histidine kinase
MIKAFRDLDPPPVERKNQLSSTQAPQGRPDRLWLMAAAAVFAALAVLPWLLSFGPLTGGVSGTAAAFLATLVPGLLLLFAARRRELLGGLRSALALLGVSMLLTAGGNCLRLVGALGVALPSVPGLDLATTVAIWALGLAALILIPLAPLAPGAAWRITTDVTIAVLGMSLAVVAIWTLPGTRLAPSGAHIKLILYNAMEAANLVVLNLIIVRGPSRPIRRAIFWLSATIVIETTYLIALEYALGRQTLDFRLSNSLFFLDYLAYLYAAASFLRDPQPDRDIPLLPESLRAFNPLPIAAILGVGVLLILAALRPSDPALRPLAAGSAVLAFLLLARVIGATAENLRLLREEAAEERRREAEKLELMGRLAGGIAHIINNQMTVVLGRAELALEIDRRTPVMRENLEEIVKAAQHASGLAERLLSASGRRMRDGRKTRILDVVLGQQEAMSRTVGPNRTLTWGLSGGDAPVRPSDLEAVLLELVSNAVDATTGAGRIAIRLRDETLSSSPPGASPAFDPGRYSVLEVEDDGPGVAAGDLPHIFEPFFTSRPSHEGRGLGLSVVQGIVASCGGSVLVDTAPGAGTRVRVYLPQGAVKAP